MHARAQDEFVRREYRKRLQAAADVNREVASRDQRTLRRLFSSKSKLEVADFSQVGGVGGVRLMLPRGPCGQKPCLGGRPCFCPGLLEGVLVRGCSMAPPAPCPSLTPHPSP